MPVSRLQSSAEIETLSVALDTGPEAGAIVKDEARCIRCGLWAERCPTGAITMEALEVDASPQTALGLYQESINRGRR